MAALATVLPRQVSVRRHGVRRGMVRPYGVLPG